MQGWDVDAWQDDDDKAQRSVYLERWIRIDYIHSKALQLLEEASTGGLSVDLKASWPTRKLRNNWFKKNKSSQLRNIRGTFIHFGKAEHWSRRLSKVFPTLIAHHCANNILHIAETKYCDALRAYLMVMTEIYVDMVPYWKTSSWPRAFRGRSSVGLQERAFFGLTAFVMQCNTKTIESIFGDCWTVEGTPDFVAALFSRLTPDAMALLPIPRTRIGDSGALTLTLTDTDIVNTSMWYSACFLVQIKIRLGLHFKATRSLLSLLPPSIPRVDPASQYDEPPYELAADAVLWPWLRDGLAGTPIARLSSASGDKWLGLAPSPRVVNDSEAAHKVYFCGEGADSVGSFFLEGSADTHTGAVAARKSYVGAHWWRWYGVITPFGMVGVWATDTDPCGWWWVWPQEWSEQSPVSQAAATLT